MVIDVEKIIIIIVFYVLAQIIYKNRMPNTNKIQLILAGAFMPDYYSSLATHFMNIWVEFESTGRYNGTQKLGFKSESNPKDTRLRVCFIYSIVVD